MKTMAGPSVIALMIASLFTANALAGPPINERSTSSSQEGERLVFVTGSRIPKRINVRRVGTQTVSPVRVIDRAEIDQRAHPTTAAALASDPAVQISGR